MGMLAWVMMGLALWHFAIWLIVNGFHIPGRHATDLLTALDAIPGAVIGMALVYFEGLRRERATGAEPVSL
jgi:hypothetical protein